MYYGARFRNGGDGRREPSPRRVAGEWKDVVPGDRSRDGAVGNHLQSPDRVGGEGNYQTMKQTMNSKVDSYARTGILPQQKTSTQAASRRHSSSIVAKLMGLDPLPARPSNTEAREPTTSLRGEKNREFKDVFEVLETGNSKGSTKSMQSNADMAVIRQAFVDAKRLSADEDFQQSQELGEALDLLDSRKDLLLKFLDEPSSLFMNQLKDLHSPPPATEARITILKSSNISKSEDAADRIQRSKSKVDRKVDPDFLPTRIVVLKPSLHRVHQKPEESTRELRRSGEREELYELRESEVTHRARRSREMAKEVTRHMRHAVSGHKQQDPLSPGGCSTLGEMLAFSDVGKLEVPSSSSPDLQERKKKKKKKKILERWSSPRGRSSKDGGGGLRQSKSVPPSPAINGSSNSFSRNRADSFDSPFALRDLLNLASKRSSEPKPFSPLRELHVDDDCPSDNALVAEKPCSSGSCSTSSAVEKYCTVDAKETSVIPEEADHPSPISVLEPPNESGSPHESFERLSADLRELRLKLQLLKLEAAADSCSDRLICSDEDDDEQEQEQEEQDRDFAYVLKVIDEAGFRRADWDDLFCGFFAPEAPICPDVFGKMEKTYSGEGSWRKSERKLLFDLFNVVLAELLAMNMELRPWVKKNGGPGRRGSLTEEAWELLCRRRREARSSGPGKFLDYPRWLDPADDVDSMGREVERMMKDDLLQELVSDVLSL